MIITLERFEQTEKSTIGKLKFGNSECYTLENSKEGAESGKDLRIPDGEYKLYWRNSPSKGRKVHVYNNIVPKERHIMIHSGNTEDHTLGCILLGLTKSKDFVGNSKNAVSIFEEFINTQNIDDITLKIINNFK